MAKISKAKLKVRLREEQARQIRFKTICILIGALLGFIIGFAGRTIYFVDAYKLSSIFKFLLYDILRWAFVACLLGGLIGYGVSVFLSKDNLKNAT